MRSSRPLFTSRSRDSTTRTAGPSISQLITITLFGVYGFLAFDLYKDVGELQRLPCPPSISRPNEDQEQLMKKGKTVKKFRFPFFLFFFALFTKKNLPFEGVLSYFK